jgi:hypothetical protein
MSIDVDDLIERALATRDVPAPSPGFTAAVMARVIRENWKAERVVDIGFNVAIAAGVIFILAGGAGLAWSLGFLTIAIDVDLLLDLTRARIGSSVVSQVQTIATAAVILTIALGLWWWAETDSAF